MARDCQPSTNSAKQANLFFPALKGTLCKCSQVDCGVCILSQRRGPTLTVEHAYKRGFLVRLRSLSAAVNFKGTSPHLLNFLCSVVVLYSVPAVVWGIIHISEVSIVVVVSLGWSVVVTSGNSVVEIVSVSMSSV